MRLPERDKRIAKAETTNMFYKIEIVNCKLVRVLETSSFLAYAKTGVAIMLDMMRLLSHSYFRASTFSPIEEIAGASEDEDASWPHTAAIKAMTTV